MPDRQKKLDTSFSGSSPIGPRFDPNFPPILLLHSQSCGIKSSSIIDSHAKPLRPDTHFPPMHVWTKGFFNSRWLPPVMPATNPTTAPCHPKDESSSGSKIFRRRLPPSPPTSDTLNQCPNLLVRPLSNAGVKASSLKPTSMALCDAKKSRQKIVDKTRTSSSSNLHDFPPNEQPPHPQPARTTLSNALVTVWADIWRWGTGFYCKKRQLKQKTRIFLRLGFGLGLALLKGPKRTTT